MSTGHGALHVLKATVYGTGSALLTIMVGQSNISNQDTQYRAAARFTVCALIFFATIPCLSAIPYRDAFEEMDLINHETKELNLGMLARLQVIVDQSRLKLENYIPLTGLPTYDNGDRVGLKILQKTLQTLLDTANTNSPIREVQKYNPQFDRSISQKNYKMNFNVSGTRAKAEINYASYVAAVLSYDPTESGVKVEVTHQMTNHRTLAYTHANGTLGGVEDRLGIRWSF